MRTKRLILRPWREGDLEPFAALNADPQVMEFFLSPLTRDESDAIAKRIIKELDEKGYGLWAVEIPNVAPFIGFIGLHYQDFDAPFCPCIEIGWRLAKEHWDQGYAFEGAKAVLEYASHILHLKEIISFTSQKNLRSIHLMEKLGMHFDSFFENNKMPKGHPLRPHVLYKISTH